LELLPTLCDSTNSPTKACLFDSDQEPQLVLAMQTGQTYVGQIVGANEWRYYEWVVEGEAPYVGNSYEIAVVFEQGYA